MWFSRGGTIVVIDDNSTANLHSLDDYCQVVETSVTVNNNSPIQDLCSPGQSYSTYLWELILFYILFVHTDDRCWLDGSSNPICHYCISCLYIWLLHWVLLFGQTWIHQNRQSWFHCIIFICCYSIISLGSALGMEHAWMASRQTNGTSSCIRWHLICSFLLCAGWVVWCKYKLTPVSRQMKGGGNDPLNWK